MNIIDNNMIDYFCYVISTYFYSLLFYYSEKLFYICKLSLMYIFVNHLSEVILLFLYNRVRIRNKRCKI